MSGAAIRWAACLVLAAAVAAAATCGDGEPSTDDPQRSGQQTEGGWTTSNPPRIRDENTGHTTCALRDT